MTQEEIEKLWSEVDSLKKGASDASPSKYPRR